MRKPLTVAVIGSADRAKPLAQAFEELPQADLRWIWDQQSLLCRRSVEERVVRTASWVELLEDEQLDAIAFAGADAVSPERVRGALGAGKHVYVEPLLTESAAEARELFRMAERNDRRLWALSPALFGAGAHRLRALLRNGTLGEIFYLHGRRFVATSMDQRELLWSVGSETVAVALDLLRDEPIEMSARATSYLEQGTVDLLFAELRFATGIVVHMHLSRLDGEESESLSVVGSEFTAVLEGASRLRLQASGAAGRRNDELVEPGSTVHLRLPPAEVTREACADFLMSIRSPERGHRERLASTVIEVVEELARAARGEDEGAVLEDTVQDEGKVLRLHRA